MIKRKKKNGNKNDEQNPLYARQCLLVAIVSFAPASMGMPECGSVGKGCGEHLKYFACVFFCALWILLYGCRSFEEFHFIGVAYANGPWPVLLFTLSIHLTHHGLTVWNASEMPAHTQFRFRFIRTTGKK